MTASASVQAERDVLACVLSAACVSVEAGHAVLDRALALGLLAGHFELASHARLYGVLGDMRGRGLPLDPVAVAVELHGLDAPAHVVGRLHVLAREVVAFNVVEHRVGVVLRASAERRVR